MTTLIDAKTTLVLMTWQDIVKLGKKEVCFKLTLRKMQHDPSAHYFGLCKLLYDSQLGEYETIPMLKAKPLRAIERLKFEAFQKAQDCGTNREEKIALSDWLSFTREHREILDEAQKDEMRLMTYYCEHSSIISKQSSRKYWREKREVRQLAYRKAKLAKMFPTVQ